MLGLSINLRPVVPLKLCSDSHIISGNFMKLIFDPRLSSRVNAVRLVADFPNVTAASISYVLYT